MTHHTGALFTCLIDPDQTLYTFVLPRLCPALTGSLRMIYEMLVVLFLIVVVFFARNARRQNRGGDRNPAYT